MTETKKIKFILDPKLEKDTFFIKDLKLSKLLLMNDCNYPWLILVPRVFMIKEIFELQIADRLILEEEISLISRLIKNLFKADKINLGALGNIVSQLHIHVIARKHDDPSWPKPVWGNTKEKPYSKIKADKLIAKINLALKSL